MLMILAFFAVVLQADFSEKQMIRTSMDILKKSHVKIPEKVLQNTKAIIVMPNLKKGGFLINAAYGVGVLSIKGSDGVWSDPCFVAFKSLSLGLQAGVESTDAIFMFKSLRSLDGIEDGKVTISFGAGLTIFKNGQNVSRKTDSNLAADIYLFGKSSGLFMDFLSVGSGILYVKDEMNDKYYDNLIDTSYLLNGHLSSNKKQVKEFKNILNDFAK